MQNNDMTSNDQLLQKVNDLKLEVTKSQAELGGNIRLLTAEVSHLTKALEITTAQQATKEEVLGFKNAAQQEHMTMNSRLKKLESWNDWAVRIVGGAVVTAVLSLVLFTRVG